MKYYLYRHIRLDKNEPFYIGIGTKSNKNSHQSWKTEYSRAYSRTRTDKWKYITSITDYKVEIMYESDSKEDIWNKEIEFIKRYGRKDLGTGTLCNLSSGGQLSVGRIHSEEFRLNQSKVMKGKNNSNYGKRGELSHNYGKSKSQEIKDKIGKGNKGKTVSISSREKISKSHTGKHKGKLNHMYGVPSPNRRKVKDIVTGEIFDSIKLAAEHLGIPKGRLCCYLRGYYTNKTNIRYL